MPSDAFMFSIITVTRNAARHLPKCLDSVAGQSHSALEHIIVDAMSSDGTREILSARDKRVSFISEPDQGIYFAMNKGLARAQGDYILFLGADDFLVDANVLADATSQLRRLGAPDFAYGGLEVRGRRGERSVFHAPDPASALEFMICGCLPHQASFAHRTLFDRVGAFDTRFRVQADYDWFLRVLTAPDVRIERLDRVVASFALGGASSRLREGQAETYAIQNELPLYQEPVWLDKRLKAFQQQLLEHRIRLQDDDAQSNWHLLRRIARNLRGALG